MSMILQNAMVSSSRQSMAAGAASLSDSSMNSGRSIVVLLVVEAGRDVDVVELVELAAVAARGLRRAIDAGHEMAQDLLGDEQRVLELDDRVGRGLEQDDVVRALAMAVDRIGQPAAAPRGDLHDLAAGRDDAAGGPVDEGLALVVRDIGAEDEHEFVAAHVRSSPSNGDAPLTVVRHGAERTDAESSTRRPLYPLGRP